MDSELTLVEIIGAEMTEQIHRLAQAFLQQHVYYEPIDLSLWIGSTCSDVRDNGAGPEKLYSALKSRNWFSQPEIYQHHAN